MRSVTIITPAGAANSDDPNASVTIEIRPMTAKEEAGYAKERRWRWLRLLLRCCRRS